MFDFQSYCAPKPAQTLSSKYRMFYFEQELSVFHVFTEAEYIPGLSQTFLRTDAPSLQRVSVYSAWLHRNPMLSTIPWFSGPGGFSGQPSLLFLGTARGCCLACTEGAAGSAPSPCNLCLCVCTQRYCHHCAHPPSRSCTAFSICRWRRRKCTTFWN